MKYDVNHFIEKFSKLDNWCVGRYSDDEGNHCAIGHFTDYSLSYFTEEIDNLRRLSVTYLYDSITCINDGLNMKYNQKTPKQRILAALHDIKKMQEIPLPEFIPITLTKIEETVFI